MYKALRVYCPVVMDTFSKNERSQIMAAVRAKNGRSTERKLRALLVSAGIHGWRFQSLDLAGKPDFIFPNKKVALFVDGCFWHGCVCCYRRPHSRRRYWDAKVARNKARDRAVNRALRKQGWSVLRIWEHALKKTPALCIYRVEAVLSNR
jgi:DNA mismatch endonuclease, patch repair protein